MILSYAQWRTEGGGLGFQYPPTEIPKFLGTPLATSLRQPHNWQNFMLFVPYTRLGRKLVSLNCNFSLCSVIHWMIYLWSNSLLLNKTNLSSPTTTRSPNWFPKLSHARNFAMYSLHRTLLLNKKYKRCSCFSDFVDQGFFLAAMSCDWHVHTYYINRFTKNRTSKSCCVNYLKLVVALLSKGILFG